MMRVARRAETFLAAGVKYFTSQYRWAQLQHLFAPTCEVPHVCPVCGRLTSSLRAKRWGSSMLDIATRKGLAALAYERAELETDSEEHPIFLADDGDSHFAPASRWYEALFRYPSTLVW